MSTLDNASAHPKADATKVVPPPTDHAEHQPPQGDAAHHDALHATTTPGRETADAYRNLQTKDHAPNPISKDGTHLEITPLGADGKPVKPAAGETTATPEKPAPGSKPAAGQPEAVPPPAESAKTDTGLTGMWNNLVSGAENLGSKVQAETKTLLADASAALNGNATGDAATAAKPAPGAPAPGAHVEVAPPAGAPPEKTVPGQAPPEAAAATNTNTGLTGMWNSVVSAAENVGTAVRTATYDATEAVVGKPLADMAASTVDAVGTGMYDASFGAIGAVSTGIFDAVEAGGNMITQTTQDGQKINKVNLALAENAATDQALANTFSNQGVINKVQGLFKPDTPGAKPDAAWNALDQERNQLTKGHQPGQTWTDNSTVYTLDKNNDLTIVKGPNDITWIGQNGKSYQKNGDVETWRNNGQTITDNGGKTYTATDATGHAVQVSRDQKSVMQNLHGLEVTETNALRGKLVAQEIPSHGDGIYEDASGLAFVRSDGQGNFLAKDSMQHGEMLVHTENGQVKSQFLIKNNQAYSVDANGKETKLDKLPSYITRNADGTLQFADVTIDKNDTIHAAKNSLNMADMATKFDANHGDVQGAVDPAKHTTDLVSKAEDVRAHTAFDPDTHESTYSQTTYAGKPEFSYDFNKGVMNADGITFTPEGTHIAGTDFAIAHGGGIESVSKWNSANTADGISSSETTGDGTDGAGDSWTSNQSNSSDSSDSSDSGD
jgi:hypothetical protein